MLDAITRAPALVRNGRLDYLAANQLGRALYAPLFESPAGPPNSARFVFLDPRTSTAQNAAHPPPTPSTSWPAGPPLSMPSINRRSRRSATDVTSR